MATIRPFRAVRPIVELASQVAALPYDVLNTEEARVLVTHNPYSFLHVDKPEMHVTDPTGGELYAFAAHKLREMISQGILVQENKPCLYIYSLKRGEHIQYGLVSCVSAAEYDADIIKKHEKTRTDKEEDRKMHVAYCGAHTGPIFLAYKELDAFTNWMMDYAKDNAPLYDFTADDGIVHTIYRIAEVGHIKMITEAFGETDALYIADGHHRAAAACALARDYIENEKDCVESGYFLAVLFPKDQLHIMDYNRVLKDESGLSKKEFFQKLQSICEVELIDEEIYQPIKRHTFGMRYQKRWYKLTLKDTLIDEQDAVASLDASLLQKYILSPIFGIEDPKQDSRIDFVGGIRGIHELNKRTEQEMDIAFSMYPTSMDELMRVADEGKLMPPKSTWFEPKLRSGLFVHLIED